MKKLVCIHAFPGFYESALSAAIDQEIESVFNTDDSGCNSNIPDDLYFKMDYSPIHAAQAKEYCEQWCDTFESETGIKLEYEYESYTSPREYNFETDRLFCYLSDASIAALFTASEADNHKQLSEHIEARFTSRDGFISSYFNDLGKWLLKPVLTWDHNELGTLLDAVLAIHCSEQEIEQSFSTWDLMENFQCNGGLSNAVWEAIPAKLQEFAELQRDYGKPVDYKLWVETGEAYEEGTTREDAKLPPLPCPNTIRMEGI